MSNAILEVTSFLGRGQEAWHRHGPALVASYAKSCGLDCFLAPLKDFTGWEHLLARLRGTDIIGIQFGPGNLQLSLEAARRVKQSSPGAVVVAGGIFTSTALEDISKIPELDYIICGEGELTFVALVKTLMGGNRPPDKVIIADKIADLDSFPWIDREAYVRPLEDSVGWGPDPMLSIITGRGCPFQCAFCQPAEDRHFGYFKRRSVENVIREIESCLKYGPQSLVFHDDTFMQQPSWIYEFCERYKSISLPFWASSRADLVCKFPDMLARLKEVGLTVLSLGLESGNQRILDLIAKGTTVEQNNEACRIAAKLGLSVFGNVIIGFPTETREEMLDTVRMLQANSNCMPSLAFFSPYPGSYLGDECIAQGDSLLTSTNWDRYPNSPKLRSQISNYEFMEQIRDGKITP